jgi:hypothetical protein
MTKNELIKLLENWETLALIKSHIIGQPGFLPLLMEVTLTGTDRQSWRAAWVADKINEQQPGIMAPWIPGLTQAVRHLEHPGKKRQFLKLISLYPISPDDRGFLLEYCLGRLDDPSDPPAVKAHAMEILYQISREEPDFKEELLQVLEFLLERQDTAGIVARAKRLAGRLRKEVGR